MFLLKLLVATAPHTLLTAELLIAAIEPVSWLAMTIMAVMTPPGGPSLQNVPQSAAQVFGLFLAFGVVPRIVLGPVLVVIEGVTFLLFRGGVLPKSHEAILSWAKIQTVMNTAASTSNTAKPMRRPSRSIIQPPAQKPVVANSAHQI